MRPPKVAATMPSARHPRTAPLNPVGRKCPSAPSKIVSAPPCPNHPDRTQHRPPQNRQSRQKPLQSCLIKANQGKRQNPEMRPLKVAAIMPSARHPRTAPLNPVGRECPSAPSHFKRTAMPPIIRTAPNIAPGKTVNQGKNPCNRASSRQIKANQGKSRQTPKSRNAPAQSSHHHAIGPPSPNRAPKSGRAEVPFRPI